MRETYVLVDYAEGIYYVYLMHGQSRALFKMCSRWCDCLDNDVFVGLIKQSVRVEISDEAFRQFTLEQEVKHMTNI